MRRQPTERRLSWLCETQADRERLLDMEHRIKPLRIRAFVVLGIALLICGPWVGWWTLIPLAIAGISFMLTERGLGTSARPEYRLAVAWLVSELAIAASVALTGGPRSPALAWLALPVVTLGSRFNIRGVVAGSSFAATLVLASSLGSDFAAIIHRPQEIVFPLALIAGLALLSVALMRSDQQHRTASVVDPLTSMLNRNALVVRIEELRHQAAIGQQPIGLIIGDLDCFKAVNDAHGHTVGDAVLCDVAYSLRTQLRAFELAYRLGGEEFLVLIPGADAAQAGLIAEQLRVAISHRAQGGLAVTMSFGVSASQPSRFDYEQAFEAADQALYAAKAAGRDRVHVSGAADPMLELLETTQLRTSSEEGVPLPG